MQWKFYGIAAHIGGETHYLLWDEFGEHSHAPGWTQNGLAAGRFVDFDVAQRALDNLKQHLLANEGASSFAKQFHRGLGKYLIDLAHKLEGCHMQVRICELKVEPKLVCTPNNYFHIRVDRDEDEMSIS